MPSSQFGPGESLPVADGSSPATAIPVGSIAEEYAWLVANLPGAQFVRQSLTFAEGWPFDVLTVAVGEGDVRDIFFDISAFFHSDTP